MIIAMGLFLAFSKVTNLLELYDGGTLTFLDTIIPITFIFLGIWLVIDNGIDLLVKIKNRTVNKH